LNLCHLVFCHFPLGGFGTKQQKILGGHYERWAPTDEAPVKVFVTDKSARAKRAALPHLLTAEIGPKRRFAASQ
jgi:hypothetical protein